MTLPVRVPEILPYDDGAEVVSIARIDTAVRAGDIIAELTSDKVDVAVEAPRDGVVVRLGAALGDRLRAGAVLAWLGTDADCANEETSANRGDDSPTLKARMLLSSAGIEPNEVPRGAGRLRAEDVEAYLDSAVTPVAVSFRAGQEHEHAPLRARGRLVLLEAGERGMFRTVSLQKGSAVPAYIERAYDDEAWRLHARSFQREHGLLVDPLLSLMAWQLAQIAKRHKKINATAVGRCRYVYDEVNLGFAVQSPTTLYLVVVRDAGRMSAKRFCERLGYLQRRAISDSVKPDEATGTTIAFSSMAEAGIVRHVPVLPPDTSVIVSHAAARDGQAALGATYDHRLLTGMDVADVLEELANPESPA